MEQPNQLTGLQPPFPQQKNLMSWSAWSIKAMALSAGSLLGLSIYGRWLIHITPSPYDTLWSLLGPLYLLTDFLNPVFASPLRLFSLSAAGLALIAFALIRGRPGRLVRGSLAAAAAAIVAAPLLLPLLYGEYRPYAEAMPGYDMHWLTQPDSWFTSAFKSAQRAHEKYGCTYSLHGWSSDNVLYFQSDCGPTVWRYDPHTMDEPQLADNVPAKVEQANVVDRGHNNNYPARPVGFSPDSTGQHFIVYETSLSPDRQWTAAAIKNYYGPRDVVVLTRSKQ